ncbi:PREDICTED: uncharacterized protein LOC109188616 [Ipomoea nil]|uniref:uncharacterized protein LOC109188616 n=1 Tax=Ipomoea nil TaxID=35883 RepID=UPI0009020151|nr:PREDICTED: uncharacterized protein LOC109188616 [Ipomoea nil]
MREHASVEKELLFLLEQQHIYWRQRAKEHWYQGGDTNSKFFHNSVKARRRRNSIKRLRDENGDWVREETGLDNVMLNYFNNLFAPNYGDMEEVVEAISERVTERDNAWLLRPLSMEEMRVSIFQMHPDKSPGTDGFGPGFFQYFWDIVGGEVTGFCRNFLGTARLPFKANDTLIVLIPKKTNPETMMDLRPIALCNVVYKIAAKRKTQGCNGLVALKLDMSKAYDRVEWKFLDVVMLKMGFSSRWVEIMLETVTSVHYHILHDQRQVGPIIPGRGFRQGDPMSPYLFLFVFEGLSALIERKMSAGLLHGVSVARGAPTISHLLFADDCFLFHRADVEESVQMRYVLDTYVMASGQHINYEKSAACFSANVPQNVRNEVVDILGVEEGDTSERYLGLPSLVGKRKRAILGFLKERILARILSWNSKYLSRAGREVLLKNVIQAMPAYAMMVYLLPLGLCRDIQNIMNQYWWTGSVGDGCGIRWRTWEGLCKPKAVGGMGFRRLHEMNKALLGKQAWRLITRPTSLVAQVFKARYYPHCDYFGASEGNNPSYIWRGMYEVKSILMTGCRKAVGDGKDIVIGSDPWLPVDQNPYVETDLHHLLWYLRITVRGQEFGSSTSLLRGVEETGIHFFAFCTRVANLWNNMGMLHYGVSGAVEMRVDVDLSSVVQRAMLFLDNWRSANEPVIHQLAQSRVEAWSKPPHGRLKLNTDAALMEGSRMMSFGWVLRDDFGNFLAAKNMLVPGVYMVKEAEILSIRDALSWLKNTGMGAVDVETDCQVVYNAIRAPSFNFAFGFLVDDVRNLAMDIDDVKFGYARRSANCAAHSVASEAFSESGCGEWLDTPPSFLVNILARDSMN